MCEAEELPGEAAGLGQRQYSIERAAGQEGGGCRSRAGQAHSLGGIPGPVAGYNQGVRGRGYHPVSSALCHAHPHAVTVAVAAGPAVCRRPQLVDVLTKCATLWMLLVSM